jgi:glycosyltransferase involved in cell wall biosynthesis
MASNGIRAKFTVAAAYGMVNMGYHRTFACAPEFTPGEDCIAAANAREMADQLRRFAGDTAWRSQLAEASRALYERAFTFESMLNRYENLLGAAIGEHEARVG